MFYKWGPEFKKQTIEMTSSPYFDSGSGIPQVDGAENFSPRVDVSEPNDKIPLLWIMYF